MKNLPEIDFVKADPEEVFDEILKICEEYLGRKLERSDPITLLLKTFTAIIIQHRLKIDWIAKQNLLAYAQGDYLDNLGAIVGVERLPESNAITTMEVRLSAERLQATTIRQGTRITADGSIYFSLDNDVVFAAGETIKTCAATCLSAGEAGNNYKAGEIAQIVDPQAFLLSIKNLTKSEGGADKESDEALRERIYEAPESFSVAGPEGAYRFWAKSTSQLIADVAVDSNQPTTVQIYVLLKDGSIPETEMLNAVYKKLSDKTKRPLTDLVTVHPPQIVNYDIDISFYIQSDESVEAAQIVDAAELAVKEYIAWQKERIGRDINPDELITRLKNVGVKRVIIRQPTFQVLDKFSVAIARNVEVSFAGLEEA